MKLSGAFTAICGIILFLSCSIKEDRSGCPCRLVLDFSKVDTSVVTSVDMLVTASDGFVFRKTIPVEEFASPYTVSVPRGEVNVSGFSGADGYVGADGALSILEGDLCPRVNMYNSKVMADAELVRDTVALHKNHSVMTIFIESEEDFPFRISVTGYVDGYDPDGRPSEGAFRYSPQKDDDGSYVVSVPRQVDNSLRLEVNDGMDVLKVFALGEYLHMSGFDWEAGDLEDVTVSLDYSLTRLSLIVEGWDEECFFEVVI